MVDPIEYPKIRLADQEYEIKFRCGDIIRMKKDGIDLYALPKLGGVEQIEMLFKLLSHGLAHAKAGFGPEELADLVDLSRLVEVDQVIGNAIKKASPQAMAAATAPVQ